jgi:conjugal transfer/entry exclusion protein
MINSKNLAAQLIVMLLALGNAGYSSVIKAGGMAVIDMANIKQTTITALEAYRADSKADRAVSDAIAAI